MSKTEPTKFVILGKTYQLQPLVMGVLFELLDWIEANKLPLDNIKGWVMTGIRDKRFMEILLGTEITDYEQWPVLDVADLLMDFFQENSQRLLALTGKAKGVLSGMK